MKRLICAFVCLLLLWGCTKQTDCSIHSDVDDSGYCDTCDTCLLVSVDLYNINDLHGKIDDGDTHLGVDEMTTYLKDAAASNPNTILLSSGDMWQGSPESNMTRGLLVTQWMNRMDFAAMSLGNHEFDWGMDAILENRQAAEFPFLAINIYDRETDLPVDYCDSSVLVDCGQVQVGIIGAIGDCYYSIASDKVSDVYFLTGDRLTALVKAEAALLRSQGADVIVYLLHDGASRSTGHAVTVVADSSMSSYYDASLSDGYVDLVFEGHTHQRYIFLDSYGVYHLQSGGDNQGISHAQVTVNSVTGTCKVSPAELVDDDTYAALTDDPLPQELLTAFDAQIAPARQVLTTLKSSMGGDTLRQLVAQLYYEAGLEKWGEEYDIVLGGGFISIRSPKYLPPGDVTYGDLQGLFPFDNELVLCSIKGSDLRSRFFESSHSSYFIAYGDYGRQVKAQIDPNATYYIVVDTYSSTYKPNKLTEIARYGEDIYARDLLADHLSG